MRTRRGDAEWNDSLLLQFFDPTRLPEVDLSEAKFGQRTPRIDVEEGAAQQATRFLPAKESVARRNESQLPIPLATGGPR